MPCNDGSSPSEAGNKSKWPSAIRVIAQHSASAAANVTTRREAESEASSGTTTNQIAAKDSMPPVNVAIVITGPASASEESTCAPS